MDSFDNHHFMASLIDLNCLILGGFVLVRKGTYEMIKKWMKAKKEGEVITLLKKILSGFFVLISVGVNVYNIRCLTPTL